MKDKGVSAKVSRDFYREMERLRLKLQNKHKIKIKSHTKLTSVLARNKFIFSDKDFIKQLKKSRL